MVVVVMMVPEKREWELASLSIHRPWSETAHTIYLSYTTHCIF